jgi:hypothetical protein
VKVQAVVTQANGIISVAIQCLFVGDMTDAQDKALIAAFGDPEINIAGSFTDPNNPAFTFLFPTTQLYVGITTQLSSQGARFMLALPQGQNPNQPAPIQGSMDCVTTNPSEAAVAWFNVMVQQIRQVMLALRQQSLVPTINPVTI